MNMTDVPARYVVGETQRRLTPQTRNRKERISDHQILSAMPGTISQLAERLEFSHSRTYGRVKVLEAAGKAYIKGYEPTRPHTRPTPIYAVGNENTNIGQPAPKEIPKQDPLMAALFGGRK